MAKKAAALTDDDYTTIGRRHGSDDVATESSEASARWTRDVKAVASYGQGAGPLATFESLRAAHAALRAKRPEAVAAKTTSVRGRNTDVAAGWAWIDMTSSVLGGLAMNDAGLAEKINAAVPAADSGLGPAIEALAKLLGEYKPSLPADADVDARIAEAPALRAALTAAPGTVAGAKASPVVDTADLDLLDGKLYVAMRALNQAARKAIRNGTLNANPSEYRFHHLNQSAHAAPIAPPPPNP